MFIIESQKICYINVQEQEAELDLLISGVFSTFVLGTT